MTVVGNSRRPLAARVLSRRLFYGWYVAIACGIVMLVGVGVGYYGLPVYMAPLKEEHGWSTTQVSWAPTIYFAVAGLTAALIGPIVDRHGPILLIAIGLVASGICAAAVGFVNELWQLYGVYFLSAVAYGLSSNVTVNAIISRWFVRRRALAISVASTGVSMGGVVMAPLASRLIDAGGLELATPVLGAFAIVVGLPALLLVVVWDPRQMGAVPDGDSVARTSAPRRIDGGGARRWSVREVARTAPFWAILFAFAVVFVAQTGYVIHQVTFLEQRLGSRNEAAFTISATALGSIAARFAVGLFADNLDRRRLTAAMMVVQATCVVLIVHTESIAATWALTLIFGLTIGNMYMLQSLLVADVFGVLSFGTVFGLISLASQLGSSAGPLGVGWLYDLSGGYTVPFTVTAALTYVGAVAILYARPLAASEPSTPPAVGEPAPE